MKPVQLERAVLSSSAPAHLFPGQISSLGWHSQVYNWVVKYSREQLQLKITSRKKNQTTSRKNKDDFAVV